MEENKTKELGAEELSEISGGLDYVVIKADKNTREAFEKNKIDLKKYIAVTYVRNPHRHLGKVVGSFDTYREVQDFCNEHNGAYFGKYDLRKRLRKNVLGGDPNSFYMYMGM